MIHSYYAAQIKTEKDLIDFLLQKGYKNPRVINARIKKNALIKYNGYFLYIIGMDARKNIEFSNATAMCLKNKYIQYVCKLEKMNKAILLSEKQKKIYTGMKESPMKVIWNCTENLQKNICIPSIKDIQEA